MPITHRVLLRRPGYWPWAGLLGLHLLAALLQVAAGGVLPVAEPGVHSLPHTGPPPAMPARR